MATSIYTITDTINEWSATGDLDDIWPTVESWYELSYPFNEDDNPTTVGDVLTELREKLNRHEPTDGLDEALALKIEAEVSE